MLPPCPSVKSIHLVKSFLNRWSIALEDDLYMRCLPFLAALTEKGLKDRHAGGFLAVLRYLLLDT